ncbi:hypothetical protein PIB30_108671, partial [Stylosanthes scabra]|nr:hypothetical protein [Stylosanthes scabra]
MDLPPPTTIVPTSTTLTVDRPHHNHNLNSSLLHERSDALFSLFLLFLLLLFDNNVARYVECSLRIQTTTKSAPSSPTKPLGVPRTRSESFHVTHKVLVGDPPYVRAKNLQ